jgi:hypothetical protein
MQLYLNQKLTEVKIVLSEIDPNITKFLVDIPPLNIQFNSSNAQLFFKTIKDNSELDIDKILKNSITFFLCGIIWIYTPNLSICDIKKYNSIQVFSQLITYLANESYSIFFTHKNTKLELDIPKIGKYRLYCMFACTDIAYLFTDIKILKIVDKLLDREFIARVYYCLLPKEDFTSYVTQRDKIDTIIRNILFYYFNHRVVIKFTESQYNNTRVRYLKSSIDLQFLSSRYLEFIRKYLV